jgi:hypothetical protein
MSEECPILVPSEGTHSDARLELKVPANDGKIRADGTVAPSQVSLLIELLRNDHTPFYRFSDGCDCANSRVARSK